MTTKLCAKPLSIYSDPVVLNYYILQVTHQSKPTRILALAPGRREFGLAMFSGIEMSYFSLKSFRNVRPERAVINEVVTLTRELIESFDPGVIAIRGLSKYQRTSTILQSMRKVLEREALAQNVPCIEITLKQIIATFCIDEKATKREAFRQLAHIYPELVHYLNRPNHWQNEYYNNLFMAASVGAVLLRTQNRKYFLH